MCGTLTNIICINTGSSSSTRRPLCHISCSSTTTDCWAIARMSYNSATSVTTSNRISPLHLFVSTISSFHSLSLNSSSIPGITLLFPEQKLPAQTESHRNFLRLRFLSLLLALLGGRLENAKLSSSASLLKRSQTTFSGLLKSSLHLLDCVNTI